MKHYLYQLIIVFAVCSLQLAFAQGAWLEGESVSVEAETCRGEAFVLLETNAGYLDLPDVENFPGIGGMSTLAVVANVGHPCLQDSKKDVVPLSLELTLPPGIEPTNDFTPICYFAATVNDDYQDVTADDSFACTATLTTTHKIALNTRDLPGGSVFLVHLPVAFTGEISASASYKEGTVRFALTTPTRNAIVAMRIPVAYAPTFSYPEDAVQFLEDKIFLSALVNTQGKAGQLLVDYAFSDTPDPFANLETFATFDPLDLSAAREDMTIDITLPPLESGGYVWRMRFVSEDGEVYVGSEQRLRVPEGSTAAKPSN